VRNVVEEAREHDIVGEFINGSARNVSGWHKTERGNMVQIRSPRRLEAKSRESKVEKQGLKDAEDCGYTYGAAYKNTVLDIKIGKLSYSNDPMLLNTKPTTNNAALHGKSPDTLQLRY
jgi:hypothetical protein